MRSVANVIGSDLAIRVLLPNEMNAASSPTAGPSKILGSVGARSPRILASRSVGSFPALSRLFASSSVIRSVYAMRSYGVSVGS